MINYDKNPILPYDFDSPTDIDDHKCNSEIIHSFQAWIRYISNIRRIENVTMLRMKEIYIGWSKEKKKYATTRLKMKPLGDYELISGSYYAPKMSGMSIRIYSILSWMPSTLPETWKKTILIAEGFPPSNLFSWKQQWFEFLNLLEDLNKQQISDKAILFTHFYNLLEGGGGSE